ncbi:MAG: hypothetical protein BAJATHORv1_60052 [Candidatus Thorarchaeota archaeon]|nr:MAG: hypothetical protein BAJATHORv1_60052 [Candidatus Thorarchaeota archaeon]
MKPLQDSILRRLEIHSVVKKIDLSPIAQCPLEKLTLGDNLQTVDLTPLAGNQHLL